MVLPILLGAAAASAAVFGAKESVEAIAKNTKAGEARRYAQAIYDNAVRDLETAKKDTAGGLESLGQQKLEAWDQHLGRFIALYEQLKNVELTRHAEVGEFKVAQLSHEELAQMKRVSFQAHEVLLGGTGALGVGALTGVASYGGAMMFASASTGTAISALSGAAATNATLAWFGGGSLASGGLGMAGGMMVLGGLVTGPILAVGGMMFKGQAQSNLAQARSDKAQARKAVEEIKLVISQLKLIDQIAQAFQGMIIRLSQILERSLDELEAIMATAGTNYQSYTLQQKHQVYLAVKAAQILKLILDTPLMTQEGAIDSNCCLVLKQAEQFEVNVPASEA